jgi:hypothetical protein
VNVKFSSDISSTYFITQMNGDGDGDGEKSVDHKSKDHTQVNSVFNARLDENHRQQKIAPKNALQCVRFLCLKKFPSTREKERLMCL